MKTIKEINNEIESLRKEAKFVDSKSIERLKSRITYLNTIKLYLETKPSQEYLTLERTNLKKQIEILEQRFNEWKAGRNINQWANPYNHYLSEVGVPDLRKKLKTIDFILE